MKQSGSNKSGPDPNKRAAHRGRSGHGVPPHSRSTPIISPVREVEQEPARPFDEGAHVDPELRHRMVSEAAYRRYGDRGYADGHDIDDWLQAETEIDHRLRNPRAQSWPAG